MKSRNKHFLVLSVGISLVAFLVLFSFAHAVDDKAVLKAEFAEAVPLTAEKEIVGQNISYDKPDLYKINVDAGFQFKVSGTANDADAQKNSALVEVYNENGGRLSFDSQPADGATPFEAYYYKGSVSNELSQETVYVRVSAKEQSLTPIDSYSFKVSLIDRTDADLDTDAGGDFSNALDVDAGTYKSNSLGENTCGKNKYCSTDEADFFMIPVLPNTMIEVSVTPGPKFAADVTIYNKEKKIVKTVKSESLGAVIQSSYVSPDEGDIFISISSSDLSEIKFGSYSLKISTKPSEVASNTSNAANEEIVAKPTSVKGGGFNIRDYLIYIIIAVVVVVGIVILFIVVNLRKKARRHAASEEVAKIREKLADAKLPTEPLEDKDDREKNDLFVSGSPLEEAVPHNEPDLQEESVLGKEPVPRKESAPPHKEPMLREKSVLRKELASPHKESMPGKEMESQMTPGLSKKSEPMEKSGAPEKLSASASDGEVEDIFGEKNKDVDKTVNRVKLAETQEIAKKEVEEKQEDEIRDENKSGDELQKIEEPKEAKIDTPEKQIQNELKDKGATDKEIKRPTPPPISRKPIQKEAPKPPRLMRSDSQDVAPPTPPPIPPRLAK